MLGELYCSTAHPQVGDSGMASSQEVCCETSVDSLANKQTLQTHSSAFIKVWGEKWHHLPDTHNRNPKSWLTPSPTPPHCHARGWFREKIWAMGGISDVKSGNLTLIIQGVSDVCIVIGQRFTTCLPGKWLGISLCLCVFNGVATHTGFRSENYSTTDLWALSENEDCASLGMLLML